MNNFNIEQLSLLKKYLEGDSNYNIYDAENKLSEISNDNENYILVSELLFLLDDESECDDIMFSIIQTIEYFYNINIFYTIEKIIEFTSKQIDKGNNLLKVIHYRIFNDKNISLIYKECFQKHSDDHNLNSFLNEIKENDVQFKDIINNILNN